jgi:hypothetical protein
MPDLLEENLEQIAKSLTPKETLEFSLANKEIYQKLLLIIFLELYKQHQEKYSNQHQDSDEEQGIFQFFAIFLYCHKNVVSLHQKF